MQNFTVEEGHLHARLFCKMLELENIFYFYHFRHTLVSSTKDSSKIYERMEYLVGSPIITCRHILVRERNSNQKYYLLVVDSSKGNVDFQSLRKILGCRKLEFVSEEEMNYLIHTYPGNVSVFQVAYDCEGKIDVILDASLNSLSPLAFHPMYNGDTIFLPCSSIISYLDIVSHPYTFLDIPMKKSLKKF